MGAELPKQYRTLIDKPMIHHTLSVFCAHPAITRIYVVISPDDELWESDLSVAVLRCGGDTRAASVLNGLEAIEADDDDWILVHDAARPCITAELLDRLFSELMDDPVGGILAVPVADTLKRADEANRIATTESRDGLWQAQTPQMFRYGLLKRALQSLGTDRPTDEAQAVEHLGFAPKLVLSNRNNLKVTFPEDIEMAEMILKTRGFV